MTGYLTLLSRSYCNQAKGSLIYFCNLLPLIRIGSLTVLNFFYTLPWEQRWGGGGVGVGGGWVLRIHDIICIVHIIYSLYTCMST